MLPTPERSADWLAAIARRHSRRTYEPTRIGTAELDQLETLCEEFRPYDDARCVLVRDPAVDIFKGIIGGYGKVSGAPHAILFIADAHDSVAQQHLGYTGEAAILEATTLNLATCWVGGFFDPKRAASLVTLAPGERIFAVSPLGIGASVASATERSMTGMAGSSTRKPIGVLVPAGTDGWPEWAIAAVESARLAPSAVNRQPWRFKWNGAGLVVALNSRMETPKVTKRLDCGIAMLHAEIAANSFGVRGSWEDLSDGLDVARFVSEEAPA